MRKVNYKEKGITLIALVITIIILLILAGVTLSTALSQNGLFKRVREGTEKYMLSQTDEEEQLKELDKYIESIVSENPSTNEKFENNGIDKTHDGAKYDPIVTDDGMWIIYKDIDTKTTKVNVYVESKYYCPSFEQFVLEKYFLTMMLYLYALPIYSFSDLSDWFANSLINKLDDAVGVGSNYFNINDVSNIKKDEYVKNREEKMNVGIFFSEILEQLGVDEYDTFKEAGEKLINQMKDIPAEVGGSSPFNYEDLEATYNKLYGDRSNLKVPETENGNKYKIKLPDGKEEEIDGKDLYKAKFRYVTTKNEEVNIEIAKNNENAQKIVYKNVNNINIDGCIKKEEKYTYTYNCLPFLDDGFVGCVYETAIDRSDSDCDKLVERTTKYRFNFGGWNVSRSDIYKHNFMDSSNEEKKIWATVENECDYVVDGEAVTSMIATYYSSSFNFENLNIPESVVYMFDTFRYYSYNDSELKEIVLPKSLKYGSYVCYPSGGYSGYAKVKIYKDSLTNSLGFFESLQTDFSEFGDNVEIYE